MFKGAFSVPLLASKARTHDQPCRRSQSESFVDSSSCCQLSRSRLSRNSLGAEILWSRYTRAASPRFHVCRKVTFSQRGLRRTLSLRESPRPGAENRAGVSPGLTQQEVNRAGYPEPESLTKPRDCPAVRSTPAADRARAAVLCSADVLSSWR